MWQDANKYGCLGHVDIALHRVGVGADTVAGLGDLVDFGGVEARREEIDGKLTARLAEGWTLARLDKTMLQILRAGTYELIARPDVPKASAISEYVDVAKAFFDDREAKFVNGVLDAVAKDAGR